MRVSWKSAVLISCIALIAASAVTWHVSRTKDDDQKLAQEATACRVSAERGDAEAQAKLGYILSHGQGVPQDYAEAVRWYSKAADQGNARGEDGLAFMYLQGHGVTQDRAEARNWYRKAADQGYAKSQYNLGNMYFYGEGMQQDRAEADRWYHKASDQGNENAQRALGLRGTGLSIKGTIGLLAMFLGCLWALKDSLLPKLSLRNRQQRAFTLAGVFGLVYVGLSLYQDFGILQSVLAVNAFDFSKNFVVGISIAMLISVFGPKSAKAVMGISGILFVGITVLVIADQYLRRFAETIYGICSLGGLLLGISISLAVFLWLRTMKSAEGEQVAG